MKRLFDATAAAVGLVVLSPFLALAMIAVWAEDGHSPFYIAQRMARGGGRFRMVKLRTMRILADRSGVFSTAGDDPRITIVGRTLRRFKLDELTQLWNVLKGDMSLVGPRPQVQNDAALYTDAERALLSIRPGITDFASIVFADEADILAGASEPDARYDQLIRPWKSRLGLLYVHAPSDVALDVQLILLTVLSAVNRRRALDRVAELVRKLGGDDVLTTVARRTEPLNTALPPGTPGAPMHFGKAA